MNEEIPDYIAAAVAHASRPDKDLAFDAENAPAEVIGFAGIKPDDKVGIIGSSGSYYLSIITNVLADGGVVYPQNASWSMRSHPIAMAYWRDRMDAAPLNNIEPIITPMESVLFPEPLDIIIIDRFYHDVVRRPTADVNLMNKAIYKALKHGGSYIVIDHHARAGSGTADLEALHRIDIETVRAQVMAAGFEFVAASDVLANPEDPRTVSARRDIMTHTDRFILKFIRP